MNAVIHGALDSTLANELMKIYDIECRFCTMLPKIARKMKAKKLRFLLDSYLNHSQLTLGKLEITFHLTGNRVMNQENKLVTDLLEECDRIFMMPPGAFDIIMSIEIIQIIGHKLACYDVINLCAAKLNNQRVLSIVSELLFYEQSVIAEVRRYLRINETTIGSTDNSP